MNQGEGVSGLFVGCNPHPLIPIINIVGYIPMLAYRVVSGTDLEKGILMLTGRPANLFIS